ncbi:ankyrin [Lindgomyces ingoldianus]|uniref:Ankyrin n=1 Tax=Lindgomyces ingoldianus TaxID=673940 RepID=A0ACB6R2Z9_9PLEO|nr:ankyrin [Lindgomyces ingoldianus]KAF2473624.1 ankyrin [Lindgomyces ingoldianus]
MAEPLTEESPISMTANLVNLPTELLLDIADILQDQRSISRLSRTSRRLHHILTDYLLKYNILEKGNTAILWAAQNGFVELARRLVALGANVNTYHLWDRWNTPLFLATKQANFSMTMLLLDAGASLTLYPNWYRNTPVMTKFLLNAGASSPLYSRWHWNVLVMALFHNCEGVARTLLSRLDSFDELVDHQGRTALHFACIYKCPNVVRYLLQAGSDVNKKANFISATPTPLQSLLKVGVHGRDERGPDNKTFQILMILLEYGAKVDDTACDLGARNTDPRVRLLLSRTVFTVTPNRSAVKDRVWMYENIVLMDKGSHLITTQETRFDYIGLLFSPRVGSKGRAPQAPRGHHSLPTIPSKPLSQEALRVGRGVRNTLNLGQLIVALALVKEEEERAKYARDSEPQDDDPFPQLAQYLLQTFNPAQKLWSKFQKLELSCLRRRHACQGSDSGAFFTT